MIDLAAFSKLRKDLDELKKQYQMLYNMITRRSLTDADKIRGITVVTDDPTDGQGLVFDAASNRYKPSGLIKSSSASATPAANTIPIADANALLTPWVIPGDWPLKNTTEGDHFLQNAASYPAGWTQVDAPVSTNTNGVRSFWNINGSSLDLTWKYREQTGIIIENLTANSFMSFLFGPVYFRDGQYPIDVIYKFGVYRNNAGVIDEQTYIRAVLKWNSATTAWQVYIEEKDGTSAHSSAAKDLSFPLAQPLYFRVVIRNDAAKLARGHVGLGWPDKSHTMLLTQTPTAAPTWGQVWLQIEMSRITGGGVDDYLFLGAVDAFATTG